MNLFCILVGEVLASKMPVTLTAILATLALAHGNFKNKLDQSYLLPHCQGQLSNRCGYWHFCHHNAKCNCENAIAILAHRQCNGICTTPSCCPDQGAKASQVTDTVAVLLWYNYAKTCTL